MFKGAFVKGAAALSTAALLLTGCGGQSVGDDEVRTLRLSHFMEPSHPHETCGMEALRDHLAGSSLAVETYPAAQLGGEAQSLEQVYTGNLEMSINGPSFLGVYHEPFNVLDAGYLFDDAQALIDFQETGELQELLDGIYDESGMKVFPAWYYGIRHITANRPIEGPSDLAGLSLRTPDAPLYRDTLGAMGATPAPMALNELYLALQQGVVDAQENPTPIIHTMSLDEVQSHLSLTGHIVQGLHISVAGSLWESLTEEEQQLLEEAILVGGDAATECVLQQEQQYLEEFRSGDDLEVHEVDTAEFAARVQEEMSQGHEFSERYVEILESQE